MLIDCIPEKIEFPAVDGDCETVRVCAESDEGVNVSTKPESRRDKFTSGEQVNQNENQNIPLSDLIFKSLIKGAFAPFINLAKGDLKTWGFLLTLSAMVIIFPTTAIPMFLVGVFFTGFELIHGTVGLISACEKDDKKAIANAIEDLGNGIGGVAFSFIGAGQCASIARVTKLKAGITPSARTGFISNCKEILSMITPKGIKASGATASMSGIKSTLNTHKFRFQMIIGMKPTYSLAQWFRNLQLFFGSLFPPLNTPVSSVSANTD